MKKIINKSLLILISVILGLVLFIWVFKQISIQEILNIFLNSNHVALFWFLVCSFVIVGLHTLRWKFIIKSSGYKVSFSKLFMYKICGMGISYLTPGAKVGGEPVRAMLLKKHNIEFHKGLSTVITDKIMELSVQGVLFIIAAITAIFTITMSKNMTVLIILFSVISMSLIIYFYYQIFNNNNLFLKWFRKLKLNKLKSFQKSEKKIIEFENIMVKFHKQDSKDFYISVFLTILTWLIMFGEYYFAANMLGINLTLKQIFMIITTMGIAYLIPIPMALGVFEAGQMTIFKMLKLSSASGIGLAIIIRVRDLMWSVLSVPILIYNGIKIKDVKKENQDNKLETN